MKNHRAGRPDDNCNIKTQFRFPVKLPGLRGKESESRKAGRQEDKQPSIIVCFPVFLSSCFPVFLIKPHALPEVAQLPAYVHLLAADKLGGMKIPLPSLTELRRLCEQSFHRHLSDAELLTIARRIVRFLKHVEGRGPEDSGDIYSH